MPFFSGGTVGLSVRYFAVRLFLAVVLLFVAALVVVRVAAADETTISYGNMRTAWDENEAGLGPAQVTSSDFGQQFATQLDGQIYAQPMVVGGKVIVATEH